jgi:hypothetical protein
MRLVAVTHRRPEDRSASMTMDEVSSHVRLDLPTARPLKRSFHLVFESHDGRADVPIP